MRTPNVPEPRRQEFDGPRRARGLDVENRRGPDFLLPAAGLVDRGRHQRHRQRLLQRGFSPAPDGVRRGSAEAAERHFGGKRWLADRKSTRLNSSHLGISYAVFCLKKKKKKKKRHNKTNNKTTNKTNSVSLRSYS